jgi:hypothetical protein
MPGIGTVKNGECPVVAIRKGEGNRKGKRSWRPRTPDTGKLEKREEISATDN